MFFSLSAERPFGIHFYSYFEQLYEWIIGEKTSSFRFVPGKTLLSTNTEVIVLCVTYFAIIFGGQAIMKNRPAMELQTLFQIRHAFLTLVSGTLLILIVEQIFPKWYYHDFLYAICSSRAWTQPLELLYYLNYLVKCWELIDVVLFVLKKKKPDPLCYYRYALNVALSFTQLNGKMTVSWIPITLNLLVHVLMHYYYFSTTTSTNVWWEKYLTALQAGQFIIDICTVYFCTYTYFSYQYWPWFPDWGNCAGSESSFVFACALLSSYLLLFLNSYRLISRVKRSRLNTAGSRTAAVSDSKTDSRSYAEAAASAVEDGSTEATRQRKSKKI